MSQAAQPRRRPSKWPLAHLFSQAPDLTPQAELALNDAARRLAATTVSRRVAPEKLAVIAFALDFTVMATLGWHLLFAATPAAAFSGPLAWALSSAAALFATVIVMASGGHGVHVLGRWRKSVAAGIAGLALTSATLLLLAPSAQPNPVALATLGVGLLVIGAWRTLAAKIVGWLRVYGAFQRYAIIAGGGPEAERVIRGLAAKPDNDLRVCAVFDDRQAGRVAAKTLDVPLLGDFGDLVSFCQAGQVDLIILTLPAEATTRIAQLERRFRVLPVPTHLSAFSHDLAFRDRAGPQARSVLLPGSFQQQQRLLKRAFDLAISVPLILLCLPVMVLIALAVRLDSPGPILFRQARHGFNNQTIEVWKFRTLHTGRLDLHGDKVVTRTDPRVTRVGRILRKSSLDELPQLFNVVAGSMSLVGPRPHTVQARASDDRLFAELVENYAERHKMPPGITGWAQINGWRGGIEAPEALGQRIAHDLYYIENWSLGFDLAILLRTPLSLFNTRRSY